MSVEVEVGVGNESPRRTQVQSLPSDFTDVQPRSYDPDFISDISNKMQVPERIAMGEPDALGNLLNGDHSMARPMNVPDRIILTGGNEHVAMRPRLQQFQFDTAPAQPDMSYVNLITPPRTLTLGPEHFPREEEEELGDPQEEEGGQRRLQTYHHQLNGSAVPVPFTPGISPNDSLLLNEEAEGTLLRTQLAKLTRRLTVMEQENQKRSQRELMLYPMVFGYFLFKVFGWFFRSGR